MVVERVEKDKLDAIALKLQTNKFCCCRTEVVPETLLAVLIRRKDASVLSQADLALWENVTRGSWHICLHNVCHQAEGRWVSRFQQLKR